MRMAREVSPPVSGVASKRIIGRLEGVTEGPTVVFFAGIHGNEPAGVKALQQLISELEGTKEKICGNLIAIAGNLQALEKGIRFLDEDLNRIWTEERLQNLLAKKSEDCVNEEKEMLALYELLQSILKTFSPPFYFIDIHTTSSPTPPFVVVNDSLLNRRFVMHYPLPLILGIEEYLVGALLSYVNELGFVAFGFESGQHEDPAAVTNAVNFIRYTLGLTGLLESNNGSLKLLKAEIEKASFASPSFYEIRYQHTIEKKDGFRMLPGFENFQKIGKGTELASDINGIIRPKKNRLIFMPLYQEKGREGFYFIKRVPLVFLSLSKFLRKLKADRGLVLLPGIHWQSKEKDTLLVNRRVARFMAKPLFHLLGYRARVLDKTHYVLKSRETASKTKDYKSANWY